LARNLLRLARELLAYEDVTEIGSLVSGEGIPTSELGSLFGAPMLEGIYLGSNRVYVPHKRRVYFLNIDSIKQRKKPTEKTRAKAEEINKRFDVKREKQRQQIEEIQRIREQNIEEMINLIEKIPTIKKAGTGMWKLKADDENPKIYNMLNKALREFTGELEKMGYKIRRGFGERSMNAVKRSKQKLFPDVNIDRTEDEIRVFFG